MPIIRSSLTQDVERFAGRLYTVAAGRAELAAENDPRVPRGQPRAGGGPRLAESFRFDRAPRRQGTRLVGTARNVAPHARYTVEGTQPHPIVAHGRALRFEAEQGIVFAKSVLHPGNAPSSWWDDVLGDVWPRSLQAAARVI